MALTPEQESNLAAIADTLKAEADAAGMTVPELMSAVLLKPAKIRSLELAIEQREAAKAAAVQAAEQDAAADIEALRTQLAALTEA